MSWAKYDKFLQLQANQSFVTASHAITLGISTFLASKDSSWIINSGASIHMSGTSNLFTRLSSLFNTCSVSITDGHQCNVSREGIVQASS